MVERGDYFNYSLFTFFRMEYKGFESWGISTFFTSLEVLISELLIVTFIGVLVGALLSKLKLKNLGGTRWNV